MLLKKMGTGGVYKIEYHLTNKVTIPTNASRDLGIDANLNFLIDSDGRGRGEKVLLAPRKQIKGTCG